MRKLSALGVALLFLLWAGAFPTQAYAYFGEDSFAPFWNQDVSTNPAPVEHPVGNDALKAAPDKTGVTHLVAPRETLWSLARYYHVDLAQLIAVNEIGDPTRLNVGRELIIPGEGAQQPDTCGAISRSYGSSPLPLPGELTRQSSPQVDGSFHNELNIAGVVSGIMSVESGGNPYSLYDNTIKKSYSFHNLNDYLATGRQLLAAGDDIDMGMMQINSANGVSLHQAANRGFAINWAANYLQNAYMQTGSWYTAIRVYNGGLGGTNLPQTYDYLTKVLKRLQQTEACLLSSAATEISLVASPIRSRWLWTCQKAGSIPVFV
ncbi:MAG: LysM peptidoglycan-binding domain-containing protein [Dehalococcoidia bacterium]|jgi:LysM repeat protein